MNKNHLTSSSSSFFILPPLPLPLLLQPPLQLLSNPVVAVRWSAVQCSSVRFQSQFCFIYYISQPLGKLAIFLILYYTLLYYILSIDCIFHLFILSFWGSPFLQVFFPLLRRLHFLLTRSFHEMRCFLQQKTLKNLQKPSTKQNKNPTAR